MIVDKIDLSLPYRSKRKNCIRNSEKQKHFARNKKIRQLEMWPRVSGQSESLHPRPITSKALVENKQ